MRPKTVPFSDVVKEIMREQDLGNRQLALKLGLSNGLVSQWLQGEIPEDENLRKLAELKPFDVEHYIVQRELKNLRTRLMRKGINYDAYAF